MNTKLKEEMEIIYGNHALKYGSREAFNSGFKSACNLLLPLLEKTYNKVYLEPLIDVEEILNER